MGRHERRRAALSGIGAGAQSRPQANGAGRPHAVGSVCAFRPRLAAGYASARRAASSACTTVVSTSGTGVSAWDTSMPISVQPRITA